MVRLVEEIVQTWIGSFYAANLPSKDCASDLNTRDEATGRALVFSGLRRCLHRLTKPLLEPLLIVVAFKLPRSFLQLSTLSSGIVSIPQTIAAIGKFATDRVVHRGFSL